MRKKLVKKTIPLLESLSRQSGRDLGGGVQETGKLSWYRGISKSQNSEVKTIATRGNNKM
jgi:hypothetical protein